MQDGSHRCLFAVKTLNSFEFRAVHFINSKQQRTKTNTSPDYTTADCFVLSVQDGGSVAQASLELTMVESRMTLNS